MVDVNKLRGAIIAKGYGIEEFAQVAGFTKSQWNYRMKTKVFDSDDIERIMSKLDIDNPTEIFFANVAK